MIFVGFLPGAAQWAKLQATGKFPYLSRWFQFISGIAELKEVEEQYIKRKGGMPAPGGDKADGANTTRQTDGKGIQEQGICCAQQPPMLQ